MLKSLRAVTAVAFLSGVMVATDAAGQVGQVPMAGRVVTGSPAIPVPGATIESGAAKAVTDAAGNFAIIVTAGRVRLNVAAQGFVPVQVETTTGDASTPLVIALQPIPKFRDEVAVEARAGPDPAAVSTVAIAPTDVRSVAGAGENIFKVLQTMPGVHATDDFGSRLSVRGGGPDQNLTVMDGVEIHNPYRLFGFTSAFNPETIARFDLVAGGFSPAHGDRLSSLLVVETRDGRRDRWVGGSASMALTDANVVAEGRLPLGRNGSWLVTGRRTYYDLVADRITDTHLPSFEDVQAKFGWDLRKGVRLSFLALRSRERTELSGSTEQNAIDLRNSAANDLGAATLTAALGSRAASRTVVSWYRNRDELNFAGQIRNESRRSNSPGDDAFGTTDLVFTRGLSVRDVAVRQEIDGQLAGGQHISTGFEVHRLGTSWDWTVNGDRDFGVANGTSGSQIPSLLHSVRSNTRVGLWLTDTIQASARLRLVPGLRVDRSGFGGGEWTVSPRLAAELAVGGEWLLRGSAGLFRQSPGYEKLLQDDYFVDLSSETTATLRSEKSVHSILALERKWRGILVRVEGYFKTYEDLIVGRLETDTERAARIDQYAFPPILASSVPEAAQVTSFPANLAAGRAYGFDVFVEKQGTGRRSRLNGWLSYTFGKATIGNYELSHPFDYDRRHAVSAVGMFRLSARMDVGGTVRVASGFPFTPALGVRVASVRVPGMAEGSPGSLVPLTDAEGRLVWSTDFGGVDRLNSGRLPAYARVDIRCTFHSASPGGRWLVYIDVSNAFDRNNVVDYTVSLAFDPQNDRPSIRTIPSGSLGRLPSVGLRVTF